MSYNVVLTRRFSRQVKKCLKKHLSIASDLQRLSAQLATQPIQGTPLGNGCYKIRLALSSAPKGKSAGARVIALVNSEKKQVSLLSIYLKSSQGSATKEQLRSLVKEFKQAYF